MDSATNPLYIFAVFIIGSCLGSFATALIHRLPQGDSWFMQKGGGASRSCCTACGHKLSIVDLMPLMSWVFLKGKCRYCSAPISCFYPVVETLVAIAGVCLFALTGATWTFVTSFLALPFLVVLIMTNIRTGANFWLPSLAVFCLGLVSCAVDFNGVSDLAASVTLPLVMGFAALLTLGWNAVLQGFAKEGVFLTGAGLFIGMSGLPLFLLVTAPLIAASVIFCVVSGRKSIDFFPSIYAVALIFHFFLTGIGFDGRAALWLSAG